MGNLSWATLENLVLVAGHGVYIADNPDNPEDDSNWALQDFQRGEPPFYVEHICRGVRIADQDPRSLLVFSGGQTRYEAGPRSEAQSYWTIADHFNWWGRTSVRSRATTEEFARDSYENLLFGICRFREACGQYPRRVEVVSWAFKEQRFGLHRRAIRFPDSRFVFTGVSNPVDLEQAKQGEERTVAAFERDPYGVRTHNTERDGDGESIEYLGDKRDGRNPFNRKHPYNTSCENVKDLLQYSGIGQFEGPLPWQ